MWFTHVRVTIVDLGANLITAVALIAATCFFDQESTRLSYSPPTLLLLPSDGPWVANTTGLTFVARPATNGSLGVATNTTVGNSTGTLVRANVTITGINFGTQGYVRFGSMRLHHNSSSVLLWSHNKITFMVPEHSGRNYHVTVVSGDSQSTLQETPRTCRRVSRVACRLLVRQVELYVVCVCRDEIVTRCCRPALAR